MKSLWTIISIISLANLLAIIALVAWLAGTKRLDVERVGEIKELLSTPAGAAEEPAPEAQADAGSDDAPLAPGVMPFAAAPSEILAARLELSTIDEMRRDRLARETADLRRAHLLERERLDRQWADLTSARSAFEDEVRKARETDGAAQFQKAVEVLNKQRPADAAAVLASLMQQGLDTGDGSDRFEAGKRQVISYINAMEDRPRNALMAQFAKDDAQLAAELLEGLRTRGLGAVAQGG